MLKNIIRELRESHNLTQEDVAKFLHIQRTTYTRYETGTNNLNLDALCRLATLYNVTADFLLERTENSMEHIDLELMHLYNNAPPIFKDIALTVLKKGQFYSETSRIANKDIFIPIFSSEVIDLSNEMIKNSASKTNDMALNEKIIAGDFAVISPDDSMINVNIDADDYVIIRPQQSISLGEIALISVNNHSLIRTVYEQDGLIVLAPANSNYQTKYFKSSNEFYIIGKMIKTIKKKKLTPHLQQEK